LIVCEFRGGAATRAQNNNREKSFIDGGFDEFLPQNAGFYWASPLKMRMVSCFWSARHDDR
jgi:hypothetical protein